MFHNKIYQNYIVEILKSFFVILFSFSIIAWTVKAVNYLDLIVESGYSIVTYLSYSLLSLTGVLTKFIPLSFLVAIVFFITKQIEEKEFTILWSSGVKKIHIVNLLLLSSLLILIFYLVFSMLITPYTLNQSRKLLSNKNEISIFPILKENQFIDAYKGVTLMVNTKIKNEVQNIFIFDTSNSFKNLHSDNSKNESVNIIAQKGIGFPRTTQQDPVPSATRRSVLSPHHVRSRSVDNHTRDSCLSCKAGKDGNEGPHAIRTTA